MAGGLAGPARAQGVAGAPRPVPAAWGGSVAEKGASPAGTSPRVIATSRPAVPGALPPDARLPLPDDGLRPAAPKRLPDEVVQSARGPIDSRVQQTVYIEPPPPPGGQSAAGARPVSVSDAKETAPAARGSAL